jgi:prolyl 4-hydroxylase
MSNRRLDADWKGWLQENIQRQCAPEELLGILVESGFALGSIKECMGDYFPTYSPLLERVGETVPPVDYPGLCHLRLTRQPHDPRIKQFPSPLVQLYTIEDFLTSAECDAIAGIVCQNLRPSTVTYESPTDKYYRTSSTSDLGLLSNQTTEIGAIEALDEKITRTLGIRPAYVEGTQGQHYAVGQEFKEHTDFFEPGTDEYKEFGGARGNRTWTFMIYLNTVTKGGGTNFLKLGHIFQPQKGMAVVWNNLYEDGTPNYDTLHAGMPVIEGEKIIITTWFRARGAGPMFYEE